MTTFLENYNICYKRYILGIIESYCGSTLHENMYSKRSTQLRFNILKNGKLGRICKTNRTVMRISSGITEEVTILRKRDWTEIYENVVFSTIMRKLESIQLRLHIYNASIRELNDVIALLRTKLVHDYILGL